MSAFVQEAAICGILRRAAEVCPFRTFALLQRGRSYANGQGVPQDYKQAIYWYTKAAEQGHLNAQWRLGWMYQKGEGVPHDNVQAYLWWSLAASQGHDNARSNLGVIMKEMTRKQIAEGE